MDSSNATRIKDALAGYGSGPDANVDLGEAALLLGALGHQGLSLEKYRNHLTKLADEVKVRHGELLAAGADDNVETQLAALKHIIADKHGYEGDHETPEHIQNADLIRVIDRGKGSPLTLAILYIHVARALGWEAYGLNLPGYFAVRMDRDGQRILFDPFDQCKLLQAVDLRRLVKQAAGPHAELSADYYEASPNRDILTRLQNHIKLRQIESGDYEGALQSVESMRAVNPDEFRLLLDAGVLYARTDRAQEAVTALEQYIDKAPDYRDRQEAALLLQQVRDSIE